MQYNHSHHTLAVHTASSMYSGTVYDCSAMWLSSSQQVLSLPRPPAWRR